MNNTPPPLSIPSELLNEWPDGARVREQILAVYQQHTGQSLSQPPSSSELEAVVTWINKNAETFLPFFLKSRRTLNLAYSASLSHKVSSLAQFHCPICTANDGSLPPHVISIRIPPVSKQAIGQNPKRKAAFERAIKHRFSGRQLPFPPHVSICLLVVFVVKAKGVQKDLDNMAKAILDATKNVLFGDDRRIDHLNIIRIKSPDEEYVYLNIRETRLNEHNDVLVPRMLHSWAGAEMLDLEDFMEGK